MTLNSLHIVLDLASAPPPATQPKGDPAWFYSGLAQSVAAVVALAGAVLLFKLSELVAEWQRIAAELRRTQNLWIAGRDGSCATPPGSSPDWAAVVDAIAARDEAKGWLHVAITLIVIPVLFVVGVVGPLLFLDEPSPTQKLLLAAPITAALIGAAAALFIFVRTAHGRLKRLELETEVAAEVRRLSSTQA